MSKQQLNLAVSHAIAGRPQEAAALLDAAVEWDLGTLPLALIAGGQPKWKQVLLQVREEYVNQEQLNMAAMLSILMHDPWQAIHYYRSAGRLREALAVASCRLLPEDPTAVQLRSEFAAFLAPQQAATATLEPNTADVTAEGAAAVAADAVAADEAADTVAADEAAAPGSYATVLPASSSRHKHGAVAAANWLLLDQPAAAAKALAAQVSSSNATAWLSLQAAARVAAVAAPHKVGDEQLELCNLAATFSLQAAMLVDTAAEGFDWLQQEAHAALQGLIHDLRQLQASVANPAIVPTSPAPPPPPAAAAAAAEGKVQESDIQQDVFSMVSVVLLLLQLGLLLLLVIEQLHAASSVANSARQDIAPMTNPATSACDDDAGSSTQADEQIRAAGDETAAATAAVHQIDEGQVYLAMHRLWQEHCFNRPCWHQQQQQQQQQQQLEEEEGVGSAARQQDKVYHYHMLQQLQQLQQHLPAALAEVFGNNDAVTLGLETAAAAVQQEDSKRQLQQQQNGRCILDQPQRLGGCGLCMAAAFSCWKHFLTSIRSSGNSGRSSILSSTAEDTAWHGHWQNMVSKLLHQAYQQLQHAGEKAHHRSGRGEGKKTDRARPGGQTCCRTAGLLRRYSRQQMLQLRDSVKDLCRLELRLVDKVQKALYVARVPLAVQQW